ncbi:Arylsulfatase [hydrothermal vent metagenome]|uniref:Arylsulfatase n=1 Tax=hydrothermal vent metagenome TaxID=652676 RepID=A0A3B0UZ25_9ZZZZ
MSIINKKGLFRRDKKNIVGKGVVILLVLLGLNACNMAKDKELGERPNVLLIMADDMGFSDIGCYGGEIQTPNIDNLAKNGIRYSQFYNAARCCPTRASLLTGVYPHQAGMGWMTNADLGTPQYRGDLSKNVVTIAEVLRAAGYSTYMTGKWHVSSTRKNHAGIKDNWPTQRGFGRYFGIIEGAGNYFKLKVNSGNKQYTSPDNFFLTNAISDTSVNYIESHFKNHPGAPFFMYVAYTSPHWPLHALGGDIAKYDKKYNVGWDIIRGRRLKKQYEIGLWEDKIKLSPRDTKVPAWDSLTDGEKGDFSRRMAIYAAQVDEMDQGIGRIVNKLKELGGLDNTIIFFLSDNGACAEYISGGRSKDLKGDLAETFESYRINWANAGSTPFRQYKHFIHEGGIRTPLIIHWPKGVKKSLNNKFIRDYGHISDIMATCVELSGAPYPTDYNGFKIVPMQGTSLRPHFSNKKNGRGPIFWEHEANIGMRDGKWKLVAKTNQGEEFDVKSLELYNIEKDPSELDNLAGVFPERLQSMYGKWGQWAQKVHVYPLDTREYTERARAYKWDINGEFDMGFGDWGIVDKSNSFELRVDESGKISGKNSAMVSIIQNGVVGLKDGLKWVLPPMKWVKQFELSFKALANRDAVLHLRVENVANPDIKIANKAYIINKGVQLFKLKTEDFKTKGKYQVVFDFGGNQVGDTIWLDAVNILPLYK